MEWLTTLLRGIIQPFQWWIVVAPWERGLRVRLGRIAADLTPGIHWRIPFLDRIYLQSIRLRTITKDHITVSSFDGHPLAISIAIDFAIVDLRRLFNTMSSPEATLHAQASAAIAQFVSERKRVEIYPTQVEAYATFAMSAIDRGLGEIQVRITGFAFVRTYRLLMNEYTVGAGLWHGYDSSVDGPNGGPK